jgi:ankyrin repeat protein
MKKSIVCLATAVLMLAGTVSGYAEPNTNPVAVSAAGNITPLCVAISKGDVAAVKKFVEYGADVNEKSNGMTPLMLAARYNNVEILQLLVSKGANVNAKCPNGFTALKYAEMSNAADAATYLRSLKK